MGRPTAEIDHGCQLATSYWPASHAAIEIPEIAAPLYLRTEHKPLTSWQVHRECEIYEILNFGKSKYGRDPLAVPRTYLIEQAAPPNF